MPAINAAIPGPVSSPEQGPCEWPVEVTCAPGWADYSAEVRAAATTWAAYTLWALSGRQYGPCSIRLRPCAPQCGNVGGYMTFPVTSQGQTGALGPWMVPWIDGGTWRNCGCMGSCSCRARCEVPLEGPVATVDQVMVDGVELSSTAYRLDSWKGIPVLVRTDGGCWPKCQDMELPDTEAGTFSITYRKGIAVPRAGQIAAGFLAAEFAKACAGAECALPAQLQSLTRNGVQVEVVDPAQLLENGLTGVAQADLWLRSVNPQAKAQRSRVYSSDLVGPRYNVS